MNVGKDGSGPADPAPVEENRLAAGPVARRAALVTQIRRLVRAVDEGDEATVEAAVLQLSSRRRIFAPLGIACGAFVMLFEGVKLLFSNWRLTIVQVLPAMWIWAAMLDLKAHVFHGKSFHALPGPVLVAAIIGVTVITAASFFLNAVFALPSPRQAGPTSGPRSPGPGHTPRPSSAGAPGSG